jgi:hypothetical protein
MATEDAFVQEIRSTADAAMDALGPYSSMQMAVFFTFSVVAVLYGYAELLQHKANKNGGGSGKREDDADDSLPVSNGGGATAPGAAVAGGLETAPVGLALFTTFILQSKTPWMTAGMIHPCIQSRVPPPGEWSDKPSRAYARKTSVDNSRYVPCNQPDTRE